MNIIRRTNVGTKEVKENLERLNKLADPDTKWVEGPAIKMGVTQLHLLEEPAKKKK